MFRAQARRHADPFKRSQVEDSRSPRQRGSNVQGTFLSSGPERNKLPIGDWQIGNQFLRGCSRHGEKTCFDGENDDIPLNFGEAYFQTKPCFGPCCGEVINELYRDHGLEIDQADSWASCVVLGTRRMPNWLVVSDYRYYWNPEKDGKWIHHFGRNSLFYCLLRTLNFQLDLGWRSTITSVLEMGWIQHQSE